MSVVAVTCIPTIVEEMSRDLGDPGFEILTAVQGLFDATQPQPSAIFVGKTASACCDCALLYTELSNAAWFHNISSHFAVVFKFLVICLMISRC